MVTGWRRTYWLSRISLILPLAVFWPGAASAEQEATAQERAQAHFERATELYAEGRYQEALEEYQQAHELVPHPSALFNMARCYENLGEFPEALAHYRESLAGTEDETERADIERRINTILQHPVRVFITSEPAGAQVLVDAREAPEPSPTPTAVELVPGPHRVILTAEGYQPAFVRIEVEVGQEDPVNIRLEPAPEAADEAGPEAESHPCRRIVLEGRRPHIALAFPQLLYFNEPDRGFGQATSGLGLEAFLNIDHWTVGGGLNVFSSLTENVSDEASVASGDAEPEWTVVFDRRTVTINLILEMSYIWSWDVVSIAAIGGVSLLLDLESYTIRDSNGTNIPERYNISGDGQGTLSYRNGQVHGILGMVVDFYIRSWFSVGIKIRLGLGSTVPDPDFRIHLLTTTLLNFHI